MEGDWSYADPSIFLVYVVLPYSSFYAKASIAAVHSVVGAGS
jgi:hypothetical protein